MVYNIIPVSIERLLLKKKEKSQAFYDTECIYLINNGSRTGRVAPLVVPVVAVTGTVLHLQLYLPLLHIKRSLETRKKRSSQLVYGCSTSSTNLDIACPRGVDREGR